MKKLFPLILLFLFACNSSDDVAPLAAGDPGEEFVDNPTPEDLELVYRFDLDKGKCFDNEKEEGLNVDHEGECGDMNNKNVVRTDLDKGGFWGADMRGADIREAQIDYYFMAKEEVNLDETTLFPEGHKPFKSMKSNNITVMKETRAVRQNYKKEYNQLNSRNRKIKKLLRKKPENEGY